MGAGASVIKEDGHKPQHEEDFSYPRRYNSGRMLNSNRSAKTNTSTTARSVRAMALLNHARHENIYMTTDEISSHLRLTKRHHMENTGHDIDSKIDESPNEYEPSEKNVKKFVGIDNTLSKKFDNLEGESEIIEATTSVKSLKTFRANFNLKLDLEDEPDWGQVSEDDNDLLDDNNLNIFDKRLIEIPLIEGDRSMSLDSPDRADAQITPAGKVVVDGLSFGTDGIIRPDKPSETKYGKLPMRERLIILCKLGAGASSAVYKALDLTDMRLVALKTIQVNEKDKRVQMVREVSALFQLLKENSRRESSHMPRHMKRPEKYIVDFYDAFTNPEDGVVCLMIEYMDGGSLQDIVDQGGCDDEIALANISVQALKGLSFLHNCSQIHRDLKPGNFLISHRGEVKVADLGIMKQLPPKIPGQLQKTNTFVGTATYMSPERIDGKEYSYPADVWAFGLSIATIALGRLPIDTKGGYWTILHGIRDAPAPSLPADKFSPEFCDFINQCMKKNPDERASCKELLKHAFVHKAEPEDLTYDQNYDRGKHELLTIIQAMYKHVESLKAMYSEKYSASNPDTLKEYKDLTKGSMHDKLFGNLLEHSTADVVKHLLFYQGQSNNFTGSSSHKHGRLTKPRLGVLSRQLHLPLDTVIRESKAICDNLQKQ